MDEPIIVNQPCEELETTVDETLDEVDELVASVTALEKVSGERHTELLGRIETCQTRLEQLSTETQSTESPMLTQIVSQLTQLQAEFQNLKLSMDSTLSNRQLKNSEVEITQEIPTELDSQNPVNPISEQPDGNVENPPEPEQKKRRFV